MCHGWLDLSDPRGLSGLALVVPGQKIALGRVHAQQTVTVLVSDTTLAIELDDQDTKIIRRTTTQRVLTIKDQRPADRDLSFLGTTSSTN
jgi:hypothetical protein